MKLTVEQLQHVLDTYDNGVLSTGTHKPDDGLYCALECVSLAQGIRWRDDGTEDGILDIPTRRKIFTDNPTALGMPDIRAINDARWSSDALRTATMLPLISVLSDWSQWSSMRQRRWAEIVSIETVKQIISQLPGLPDSVRLQCKQADTLKSARAAANAAAYAAHTAANAAAYAAYAAYAAAYAVAYATGKNLDRKLMDYALKLLGE